MEFQWLSFIGEILWAFLWFAIGFVVSSIAAMQLHFMDRQVIATLRYRLNEERATKWSDTE